MLSLEIKSKTLVLLNATESIQTVVRRDWEVMPVSQSKGSLAPFLALEVQVVVLLIVLLKVRKEAPMKKTASFSVKSHFRL